MQHPYNVWGTLPSGSSSEIPPSIYGALPWDGSSSNAPSLYAFYFTTLNPSIIDCTVIGPNNEPQFYVTTNSTMPGYTVLKAADGRSLGLIEWKNSSSQVEIRGAVPKQATNDFLRLSHDHRYRIMRVGGRDYILTSDEDGIRMYLGGDMSSKMLAKVTRNPSSFKLEISSDAVQAGLLHSAVVAIVLLESGLRI
ncbi:uncharacterized protein BT62DRAFT_1073117 [Guyanagaster necrorhizus]|uniref:Uncharacterized protein n=1 Tax=Guyanagaster necrorhizus TaxID=856835 RepID=A0A9P7W0A7_9AGAR|nr:uncharacterized protein BT62DRAFT_1073117 [Guyanagaster necrorhizus MCA 3950]KAG7449685.1 hypothetical protein BT62DRAFT_1073117 [Guyanagaster necrorhizus MCA 3950]